MVRLSASHRGDKLGRIRAGGNGKRAGAGDEEVGDTEYRIGEIHDSVFLTGYHTGCAGLVGLQMHMNRIGFRFSKALMKGRATFVLNETAGIRGAAGRRPQAWVTLK